jgi:hypothetical protein
MPQSAGEPEPTEAPLESSSSEESDSAEDRSVSREDELAAQASTSVEAATEPDSAEDRPVSKEDELAAQASTSGEAAAETADWWTAQPVSDWAQSPASEPDTEPAIPKGAATADVYFCGHTALLSLNRALQAIAKEKLTGALRAFWDREPIELLAQDGTIVLATTRDPDLYCPDAPAVLANVDPEIVATARARQSETGMPFFLTLARQESIVRQPALELVQHYGLRLFSQLWTAPRVWIMFEKNAELLGDVGDVPAEANADDWALESLRLVGNVDQPLSFEPASIPGYTKDGYERIQKLTLTADEAQFASQFNGVRSVQQIAKNLRLDLKSAHWMLFRFLALEVVECWPASAATEPESKSVFQRFKRSIGRSGR